MVTPEHTLIKKISKQLDSLPNGFSLKSEDKWLIDSKYLTFDLEIFYKNSLYAILDLKVNLLSAINDSRKRWIKECANRVGCRFGILTDGEKGWFYDKITAKEGPLLDFSTIISSIVASVKEESGESHILDENIKSLLAKEELESYVGKLENDISSKGKWKFTNAEDEQAFFEEILNKNKQITEFCRYTSLTSLITMLNSKTYQMCGIAGMNDKSETDYFDNKYSRTKQDAKSLSIWNDIYLSSGTLLKDDLTMWRLYGDDGRGVCLIFEVIKPTAGTFYIANVDYEDKRKSHKWVKFIKDLEKKGIKFNKLNVWKHFFKPNEYSIEEEIRLVFYDNGTSKSSASKLYIEEKWILTNGSSIIIPVVRFDLLDGKFPLKLRKIILGSKISEHEINKAQLEYMLSSKSISNVSVEYSNINNYR